MKLSEKAGVGCVAVCSSCDDVHVVCGKVALRFTREEFQGLGEMVRSALRHPLLVEKSPLFSLPGLEFERN